MYEETITLLEKLIEDSKRDIRGNTAFVLENCPDVKIDNSTFSGFHTFAAGKNSKVNVTNSDVQGAKPKYTDARFTEWVPLLQELVRILKEEPENRIKKKEILTKIIRIVKPFPEWVIWVKNISAECAL